MQAMEILVVGKIPVIMTTFWDASMESVRNMMLENLLGFLEKKKSISFL